ncbi:MAG TPA: amino acid permease, partial [Polyangiaceae bacterium]|nr:amino acid permease [Polyangiaceae bacterium]
MAQPPNDDASQLSRLGYAQELLRSMGGFSNFAISFSIISVLTGVFSTYKIALQGGGPAGLGLGWPLVCVGSIVVAVAMAELASAFPTAGALYHWSALLGGPGAGWMVAATNLVGQVAIVAAIDVACAKSLASTLALGARWQLPIFFAVIASHAAINLRSIRWVAVLNDFSATVHVVGVALLVGLLWAFGRAQPLSFLAHTGFTTRTDGRYAIGFLNALTLGMWTMTGFDASAHASEETRDAARRAPRGIVSAVAVSAVAGYALVCALTLSIGDVAATARSDDPALEILRGALGHQAGRVAMFAAIVAMWFCGLSSVTSASRTFYAFARDDGLPFSRAIRKVSPRFHTPPPATVLAVVLPCLLVVVASFFSDEIFDAISSLATTALYVSYGAPIALGIVARHQGRWRRRGPWNLGRAGVPLAYAAVAYCAFVLVVFALPPNQVYGMVIGGV